MTGYLHAISWYITGLSGLICLALFSLQLRAYRRVRHRSIGILVASSVIALASNGLFIVALTHLRDKAFVAALYLAVAVLTTAYGAIGVWGTAKLFEAFEATSRPRL